jgi:hypothetical protein
MQLLCHRNINRSSTLGTSGTLRPIVYKDFLLSCKFSFDMANNIYHNPNYNFPQPRNGIGRTAYLLGIGLMPPPCPQDIAVAMANHLLDHQATGLDDDDDNNKNINPQL